MKYELWRSVQACLQTSFDTSKTIKDSALGSKDRDFELLALFSQGLS